MYHRSATKAVEYMPEWSEGHLTLARCQLHMGELELAIKSFEEALRLVVDAKYVQISVRFHKYIFITLAITLYLQ